MSHAVLSTVGVLVQGLSRFAFTAFIGRFMGPSDLAHVSAWLALALVLSLLWPTGAGNAASNFLARAIARGEDPSLSLRAIERSFWTSCAIMVAAGVPVAVIWLGADWGDAIAVASLIVAYSGYIFTRGVQVGLGRLLDTAIWDLVSAVTTTVLLVAVLLLDMSTVLLWPIVIGYGVFTARVLLTAPRPTQRQTVGPVGSRRIWHSISWNSVGLLASNGLIQFSMLYVFAVSPTVEAGLYAAAMSLATPASMLSQAVSQVLLARFSHWSATDTSSARRKFIRVMLGMTLLLAVIFAIVALCGSLILAIVFGPAYLAATTTLQVLLAAVFAFSVTLVANVYLLSTGQTVSATIAALVGLVGGLATMALCAAVGLSGASSASLGVLSGYVITLLLTMTIALGTGGGRTYARWRASPVE